MIRSYYDSSVSAFLEDDASRIIGLLSEKHRHALEESQKWAWIEQIKVLQNALSSFNAGHIFLELYIPRLGKRADAVLALNGMLYILEFKVGSKIFNKAALMQVEDYSLDLKNFHKTSHSLPILGIVVATEAEAVPNVTVVFADDLVAEPLCSNANDLGKLIRSIDAQFKFPPFNIVAWKQGGYEPTPTIIEAAQALYRSHSVSDISRSGAGAINLQETSQSINDIIDRSREQQKKSICFVTGVPGAGKTLAGLNIATQRSQFDVADHAVFLSGNGPLVAVLREALARDKVERENVTKTAASREVASFIQNIHHFRDEYVGNEDTPLEKIVIFDEAQRAWSREQASRFMQRKRGQANFAMSEPEFLISVMDRHTDWCTIICLIGNGQEINTGEAGISEWMIALSQRFPHWEIHVPDMFSKNNAVLENGISALPLVERTFQNASLHLAVSLRSFRAESLSLFVEHMLDGNINAAAETYEDIKSKYPIRISRDLKSAKEWVRGLARGSERIGVVASSKAHRLRPIGIFVEARAEPAEWFLNHNTDIRSSCYLESVGTEFEVQGLELDWAVVCWDGNLYHNGINWIHQAFKGNKWNSIANQSLREFLVNAYRVLLTRARQGMVIVVPNGDESDWTRPPELYDGTFAYLKACGIQEIENVPAPKKYG